MSKIQFLPINEMNELLAKIMGATTPSEQKEKPPDVFISILYNGEMNQAEIFDSDKDYYHLVEKTHDHNIKGSPFLFLNLTYSKEQNDKLNLWVKICCNGSQELHTQCIDQLLPQLNGLIAKHRQGDSNAQS